MTEEDFEDMQRVWSCELGNARSSPEDLPECLIHLQGVVVGMILTGGMTQFEGAMYMAAAVPTLRRVAESARDERFVEYMHYQGNN